MKRFEFVYVDDDDSWSVASFSRWKHGDEGFDLQCKEIVVFSAEDKIGCVLS